MCPSFRRALVFALQPKEAYLKFSSFNKSGTIVTKAIYINPPDVNGSTQAEASPTTITNLSKKLTKLKDYSNND